MTREKKLLKDVNENMPRAQLNLPGLRGLHPERIKQPLLKAPFP